MCVCWQELKFTIPFCFDCFVDHCFWQSLLVNQINIVVDAILFCASIWLSTSPRVILDRPTRKRQNCRQICWVHAKCMLDKCKRPKESTLDSIICLRMYLVKIQTKISTILRRSDASLLRYACVNCHVPVFIGCLV